MTNNETVLRQNCADLQAQLAAANSRISDLISANDRQVDESTDLIDRYDTAIRSLMSFLSVGGYAETITPEQGEAAIRDGIEMLMKPAGEWLSELSQLRAEKAAALVQKPVAFWWIGPDGKDNGGPYRGMASEFAIDNARNMGCKPQLLYAAPVQTSATVPENNLPSILLKTSPFITCVSGDGKPKVVLQFSSLTDAQDVFCAIHNSALLRSAQSAVTAKATVPDGWSIRREGERIVIQKSDIGGVVVKQNPSEAREIPEAILWALANDLLQSAQEPKL